MAALLTTFDRNGFPRTFPCLCVRTAMYLGTAVHLISVLYNLEIMLSAL